MYRILILLSLSILLGARSRDREAMDPYETERYTVAVITTEFHSQPQKLGFGQKPSTWKEFWIVFYNRNQYGRLIKRDRKRLDRDPKLYRFEGLYRFYSPKNGQWGTTVLYKFEKLFRHQYSVTHKPAF